MYSVPWVKKNCAIGKLAILTSVIFVVSMTGLASKSKEAMKKHGICGGSEEDEDVESELMLQFSSLGLHNRERFLTTRFELVVRRVDH